MSSIWKTTPKVDEINEFCKNTAVSHLGIEITEVGPDFLRGRMPVDSRTHQPAGLLHGGASVLLAESLGSIASVFCRSGQDELPVGIEINANHLRSVKDGFVIGTARPVHLGRSLHVWEIKIENEKQQLCCVSRLTVQLIKA